MILSTLSTIIALYVTLLHSLALLLLHSILSCFTRSLGFFDSNSHLSTVDTQHCLEIYKSQIRQKVFHIYIYSMSIILMHDLLLLIFILGLSG